jgi:hypothetical protein
MMGGISNSNGLVGRSYRVCEAPANVSAQDAEAPATPSALPANPTPAPEPNPLQVLWSRMAFAWHNWTTETPPVMQAPAPAAAPSPDAAPAESSTLDDTCPLQPQPELPKPIVLDPDRVDTTSVASINNFCWQAAKQILGRKPQGSEVAWWRDQVLNKHRSARDVQDMMSGMPEARMNTASKQTYGRILTDEERLVYNTQRRNGTPLETILADIVNCRPLPTVSVEAKRDTKVDQIRDAMEDPSDAPINHAYHQIVM